MAPKKAKSSAGVSYSFPESFLNLSGNLRKQFYKPQPESVVEDQIIVIENFFSKELCNELIKSFEKGLTLETTPLVKSKEYAVRVNDRCALNDFKSAEILWDYLKQLLLQDTEYEDQELKKIKGIFKGACGLNPQLRVYRYKKGHHFNSHYDESVTCPTNEKGTSKGRTKWTLLIYLTGDDEFLGGGTIFHPDVRGVEPLNIHPGKGMALLHKHGDDCLRHEGELVRGGEKWVLRSDVVYPL
ncbi:uncharacterized protein RJT20DRAFT_60006 [Scheffersomyces xylosifermentans]|uniref:uncharacterized protein n=1 Tax=Scheffersomyces xylosifermentans TaxID=1304137 RepID=UPI00315CE722